MPSGAKSPLQQPELPEDLQTFISTQNITLEQLMKAFVNTQKQTRSYEDATSAQTRDDVGERMQVDGSVQAEDGGETQLNDASLSKLNPDSAAGESAPESILDIFADHVRHTQAAQASVNKGDYAQARAGQPISPAATFREVDVPKPVTPADVPSQHTDEPQRSKIARESSRASLQSPEETPQSLRNDLQPTVSQWSQKSVLLSSDPNESPMRDMEPSDPAPATEPSSPSKYLDEDV